MRTAHLPIIFFFSTLILTAQPQPPEELSVAITFDDLPVVCRCETHEERQYITERLISTFKAFHVPVLGVVNEQKVETDGVVDSLKVSLLTQWLDAGYELGNHGYSHKNINE